MTQFTEIYQAIDRQVRAELNAQLRMIHLIDLCESFWITCSDVKCQGQLRAAQRLVELFWIHLAPQSHKNRAGCFRDKIIVLQIYLRGRFSPNTHTHTTNNSFGCVLSALTFSNNSNNNVHICCTVDTLSREVDVAVCHNCKHPAETQIDWEE